MTPELRAGSYVLTELSLDDGAAIARLVPGDPEMKRWSSIGRVTDEASADAWLRGRQGEADRQEWGIRDENGALLGRVALRGWQRNDGIAEIGYGVFAPYRRRGILRVVVPVVSAHGFEGIGVHRIELVHAVANTRSCRVAQTCGFALEGTLRQGLDDLSGGWEDAHLHARLATD